MAHMNPSERNSEMSERQARAYGPERQDRRPLIGSELRDVHHDGGERFRADVGAFHEPVREEERRHERSHAPHESR